MDLQAALNEYLKEENFFAPEYDQENEILRRVREEQPVLMNSDIDFLKSVLDSDVNWQSKFFVADLMYLYVPFDRRLFESMLWNAIKFEDPSFNRIFLYPCIMSFGLEQVRQKLSSLNDMTDQTIMQGIDRLGYWMHEDPQGWKRDE